MGYRSRLNQFYKQLAGKSPEAIVYEALSDFYKKHPRIPFFHNEEIKKIRGKCDTEVEALQQEFDAKHSEITVKVMKEELAYLEKHCSEFTGKG